MAKWGEGDPRWIVEERADATNVNNWHWTEKNATSWSKDKLKSLLDGFIVKDDGYECKIKELTSIEGEATANNRKAKLIFFFEWVIKGEWTGQAVDSNTSYNGNFEIPNLSEENDADEIDVIVSVKSDKNEAHKVKDFMRKKGQDKIREQLAMYIQDLKNEYSKGLILPTKNGETNGKAKSKPETNPVKKEMNKLVLESKPSSVGVKIGCKKITDKQEFKCRASELYRAFTEKDMVRAYSGGDSMLEAEKGGRFCLFNGNVTGEFTNLLPYEKLCFRWRFKTWPEEHYSEVTLKFNEKDDCTNVVLTQISVPESDFDRTKEGWKRYYWDGIKYKLGFGAQLF